MTTPLPAFPQHPTDVPDDAELDVLVEAFERHLAAAVLADRPPREPVAPADVPRHALAALAILTSLVGGLTVDRWAAVRSALLHGATAAQVAAALGEPADDLLDGLAEWATQRVVDGLLDVHGYAELLALTAGASNTAPAVPASTTAGEEARDDLAGRLAAEQEARWLAGRILDTLGREDGAR